MLHVKSPDLLQDGLVETQKPAGGRGIRRNWAQDNGFPFFPHHAAAVVFRRFVGKAPKEGVAIGDWLPCCPGKA
jgi:uncharacterized MAPEG superfamily protein